MTGVKRVVAEFLQADGQNNDKKSECRQVKAVNVDFRVCRFRKVIAVVARFCKNVSGLGAKMYLGQNWYVLP